MHVRVIHSFLTESIPSYGFGTGNGPIVYSNVDCSGWENSLSECSSETYLAFDCPPFEAAGVLCADCKSNLGLFHYTIVHKVYHEMCLQIALQERFV